MKIERLKLNNFMIFDELDIQWSPNINVISGENSTGKTTLLKILYSSLKSVSKVDLEKNTKEQIESVFVEKMTGIFRPDNDMIGRLVSRKQGSNKGSMTIFLEKKNSINIGITSKQEKHINLNLDFPNLNKKFEPVYLPPKEMISATEHFASLYEDYHIDFEEMYYDLTKLLDRPLKRGKNTEEQNAVLSNFEKNILNGKVIQKDKKFYLKMDGAGEFEMGLVSEGYRKLATIIYLISSGSLGKNSVLFWDEPETNMNPNMIKPIADAIVELAKMGVQVFITTHDYFVQQCFNLISAYPQANESKMNIKFVALNREGTSVVCETASKISQLKHNTIMEEFNALYDREQDIIYEVERRQSEI